jgi:hypothetical protein
MNNIDISPELNSLLNSEKTSILKLEGVNILDNLDD